MPNLDPGDPNRTKKQQRVRSSRVRLTAYQEKRIKEYIRACSWIRAKPNWKAIASYAGGTTGPQTMMRWAQSQGIDVAYLMGWRDREFTLEELLEDVPNINDSASQVRQELEAASQRTQRGNHMQGLANVGHS